MKQTRHDPQTQTALPREKRRLRKGTFSCIECKRRKVRCFYSSADSVSAGGNGSVGGQRACAPCRRRATPCIGQDAVSRSPSPSLTAQRGVDDNNDDKDQQKTYRDIARRIGEVEALVDEIMYRQVLGVFTTDRDDKDDHGNGDGDGDDDIKVCASIEHDPDTEPQDTPASPAASLSEPEPEPEPETRRGKDAVWASRHQPKPLLSALVVGMRGGNANDDTVTPALAWGML